MKTLPLTFLMIFISTNAFTQMFAERGAAMGIQHACEPRDLTGGGIAFFDYDNDGDEDLYLTSGTKRDELYRNNSDGTFTKVLDDIGLGITSQYNTTAITTGDIDNDGDRDLFVTTWEKFDGANQPISRHLLFENNGDGTFTEIGVASGITHAAFGMGATFLDFNKDGYLDIYVMNHIENRIFTYDSIGAVNGFAHECYSNLLYKNNGDLTFTEMASAMGIDEAGCTIAAVPTDFDLDGDLDLYLANDFGGFVAPNVLYKNNFPENNFEDISEASGSDVQVFGMGIASGDYDHDLDIDYYITSIGRNALIENNGDGTFTDVTAFAGVENTIVPGEGNTTGWGTAFLDINNNTLPDLFVANGRMPTLPEFATATNDPNKLYLNNGDKTFTDITDEAGVGDISYGRGLAYSDFDKDGDLDVFVSVLSELGAMSKFYVNEIQNDNHFVQFKLIGVESNRDAYGSKLWLYAGGETYLQEIYSGGDTYASQNSSIVHFGLKDIEQIDSLRIDWTNGHVDHLKNLEIDRLHILEEGVVNSSASEPNELGINIFPNPFNNYITLKSEVAPKTPVRLTLTSVNGKLILDRTIQLNGFDTLSIDEQLPPGIYIIQLQNDESLVAKKMVKL